MAALFACSRCLGRHPFDELSQGQQLCKECRGSYPMVKCTYCRSEFQQESKNSTVTICKKCDAMVKSYGKPSACEYCNVIAAFIGNKCQRCTYSERKFGLPLSCEQCKQKCAFDRKEEDKKVDGKLLCWLCTLSYKRALAKTKVTDPARHSRVKISLRHSHQKERERKHNNKRPNRPDVTLVQIEEPPTKHMRTSGPRDNSPSSGDQLTVITQLREQIAGHVKQLAGKDSQLLAKDRQMTELKATQYTAETEMRAKMKVLQREHDSKVDTLQLKIKSLSKEIAQLNKGKKKKSSTNRVGTIMNSMTASGTDGGSSGTDSPSVN